MENKIQVHVHVYVWHFSNPQFAICVAENRRYYLEKHSSRIHDGVLSSATPTYFGSSPNYKSTSKIQINSQSVKYNYIETRLHRIIKPKV
jgi:hypothetical protein